jgi:hypothetical protein
MTKHKPTQQEEEEVPQDINVVQIGDIHITSTKGSLKNCVNQATDILKNKEVKDYLSINLPKRKLMGL